MDSCNKDLNLIVNELRQRITATQLSGSIVPRTDSNFLARFVRVKDYDIDEAFNPIKKYYECIQKHMDLHKGMRPSDYAYVYDSEAYLIFQHRLDGVLIVLGRVGLWEPKVHPLIDCERAAIFAFEEYLYQVETQENGVTFILDCNGMRLEHLWHFTVKEIRRCVEVLMYALPMRIKSFHILHPPSIIWPIFYVAKRLMKLEIVNRIHFHADFESFHKHLDKKFLPDCLGGDLSEEQVAETSIIEQIKREDIPFEEYWNGAIRNEKEESSFSILENGNET